MEIQRPHAVCIPYPAQGHISAMLKLAKLLHHKGFHITYVLTQFNYTHIMKARNSLPLSQSPTFRFETIPDGLPSRENPDTALDIAELCFSTAKNCYAPFMELIDRLNRASDVPPVSCVVSDTVMAFTVGAAQELDVIFGDYTIDWIPGIKSIGLSDIPTTAWSTDPNNPFIDYMISQVSKSYKASAVIFHTFDELEPEVCEALSSMFNRVYTIGPIPMLLKGLPESEIDKIKCNLWKEDLTCTQWLDTKNPKSVVYVNFGSLAITNPEKLVELAMGLSKSTQNFLWIIRPELISGDWSTILPPEFTDAVKDRGYIANWCDQEQVLNHPSVGGFLTHCGWNSMVESMSAGVAMVCWSFFADQPLNRYCCCSEWRLGLEIENDVKRENVESVVRELMEGEKGREVKKKALFWKERAEVATSVGGSSFLNLDKLIGEVLLTQWWPAFSK
nr:7-deoxyloganetin glucosyltransferase-like [Ipomoea batatas]